MKKQLDGQLTFDDLLAKESEIEMLYTIAKEFVEKKARIQIPALEKFEYNENKDVTGEYDLSYIDAKKMITICYVQKALIIEITKTHKKENTITTEIYTHKILPF